MRILAIVLLALLTTGNAANGSFVSPKIGGGQVGSGSEDPQLMIHIHVGYDGSSSRVEVGADPGIAALVPLSEPDEFDPAKPWGVLGSKAYNFQYGWLASSLDFPPNGAWLWIEQISATPGLEVYQRPPASPAYDPIFGTADSSTRWRWSGAMTHNVYAVQDPMLNLYEAEYRVYIGDDVTGEPWQGYTPAEITLQFDATPILEADFDDDRDVDGDDLLIWQQHYGESENATKSLGDADVDNDVDGSDLLVWQRQYTGSAALAAASTSSVPEPGSIALAITTIAIFASRRRALLPH